MPHVLFHKARPDSHPVRDDSLNIDVLTRAFCALRMPILTRAIEASGLEFAAPITRDGTGWRVEVDLPAGLTVDDITARRDRLAAALRSPLSRIWPSAGVHPGRLVLFIADYDLAMAPLPTWPLITATTADVFSRTPWGVDPHGRSVDVTLVGNSVLIGGQPDTGMHVAVRPLVLAAALDPLARLWVYEGRGIGNFAYLAPLAERYSPTLLDDVLLADLVDDLRALTGEIQRRARVLTNMPAGRFPSGRLTRELSTSVDLDLRPIVLLIDECQELFTHPNFGAEAAELATRVVKLGPALGVVPILTTHRADRSALPVGIATAMRTRLCLRVAGQVDNDLILGVGAYRNGVRACNLTERDRGVGYLAETDHGARPVHLHHIDSHTAERATERAQVARLKRDGAPW